MQKILPAEIWTIVQTKEGCAVLLRPRNKNVAVPVFVGKLEVQSILIGKDGIILPRPLTHDLMLAVLESQGLKLDRVEIHDLKDNIFHAQLVITGGTYTTGKPLVLDSRPSDAFALVVRCKCPIFISAEIVKETGIPVDFFLDAMENNDESINDISPLNDERSKLLVQLNDAVENEEYERAAEIRDLLKIIDDENE